jgi:hypothetical protein
VGRRFTQKNWELVITGDKQMKFWIQADISVPVEVEIDINDEHFETKGTAFAMSDAVKAHLNKHLQGGPDDRVHKVLDVDIHNWNCTDN